MKLLMLNNEFPPLGGGTATVTLEILKQFSNRGDLQVTLITSGQGSGREVEQFNSNISIVRLPLRPKDKHHQTVWDLCRYARMALTESTRLQRQQNFDLCWAWGTVPAGAVAAAIHSRFKLPYIVRVMGPDIPGFEARYNAIYPVLRPIIKAVWKRACCVVAKCAGEERMIRSELPQVSLELVYNGVDADTFQPGAPKNHDEIRLLCVGRLIKRKGQYDLIVAVSRLVGLGFKVKLTLVGEGDDEARLRQAVTDLSLSESVEFVGYVPRESISEQYHQADVFVLPSYNEGMSVSLLEALASGLPVVSSKTGGTDELIEEGENGLTFPPGDIEALVEHLKLLCGNEDRRVALGKAARDRALQFSWAATAERYDKILTACAGR